VVASNSVIEVSKRYDDFCTGNTTCVVTLDVTHKMSKTVYMYYRLENFYQNHRRYVKSRSDGQLQGSVIKTYGGLSACDPIESKDNSRNPDDFYLPCGLIAWSLFNDTFILKYNNETVPLDKNGIAWKSDLEHKFKNPPADTPGIRLVSNFTDEDFVVWMRTAGLPNFKKLYRIIHQDLEPGEYQVLIHNTYPVHAFGGKKYIVLSTVSWIGGKNPFLGWAYIAIGILCVLLGTGFGLKHAISPRRIGDPTYMEGNVNGNVKSVL